MPYDRDEWRRPWRAEPAEPVTPVVRHPQPPPDGFGAHSDAPGSPAGSIRPPDTVGTVDPPAPARRRLLPMLLTVAVGAVLGTLGTLTITGVLPGEGPDARTMEDGRERPAPVSAPADGQDRLEVVPTVAAAVTPSVVRIDVSAGSDQDVPALGGGLGSGVILRPDGYIVTNHHVIDGASDVEVRLATGDIYDAEVVGSDELNDVAVLRIEAEDLPAIALRPEDEPLQVGETVVAIGSPFGLDASVTTGVISALEREIRLDEQEPGEGVLTIPSIVQTDAAINPGNSGGALVDAQGRLVGINTAILTRSGASQGVGFAVGYEQAVDSAEQLIDQGFVRHPLLGIAGMDVSADDVEELGLPARRGALVEQVQPDSGAAAVDLRAGDVILAVDGEPLSTMSELVAEVRRRSPGEEVRLEVFRDGRTFEVEVELGERPR